MGIRLRSSSLAGKGKVAVETAASASTGSLRLEKMKMRCEVMAALSVLFKGAAEDLMKQEQATLKQQQSDERLERDKCEKVLKQYEELKLQVVEDEAHKATVVAKTNATRVDTADMKEEVSASVERVWGVVNVLQIRFAHAHPHAARGHDPKHPQSRPHHYESQE